MALLLNMFSFGTDVVVKQCEIWMLLGQTWADKNRLSGVLVAYVRIFHRHLTQLFVPRDDDSLRRDIHSLRFLFRSISFNRFFRMKYRFGSKTISAKKQKLMLYELEERKKSVTVVKSSVRL